MEDEADCKDVAICEAEIEALENWAEAVFMSAAADFMRVSSENGGTDEMLTSEEERSDVEFE